LRLYSTRVSTFWEPVK